MISLIEHKIDWVASGKRYELSSPQELENWYQRITGFRSNFVVSAVSGESNSALISNANDRIILRIIRSTADLIVTTGKTAVDEDLVASKYAPLLVLTNRDYLDVPATRQNSEKAVFVTTSEGHYKNSSVVTIGKTKGALASWLLESTMTYESIILECGLTVTKILQELISELCLTVTDATDLWAAQAAADKYLAEFDNDWVVKQLIEIEKTWFFIFTIAAKTE